MRLATREVIVVMILMNDHQGGCGVYNRDPLAVSVENHPVVPTSSADRKFRHVGKQRAGENKVIASGRCVQLALFLGALDQPLIPTRTKVKRLPDVQVPALSDDKKSLRLAGNLSNLHRAP